MAKKSTMTEEERDKYLKACDFEIRVLKGICGPLCSLEELLDDYGYLPDLWGKTEYILKGIPVRYCLRVLQSPKEVSDYSSEHLKQFRDIMAGIRDYRYAYLKQYT